MIIKYMDSYLITNHRYLVHVHVPCCKTPLTRINSKETSFKFQYIEVFTIKNMFN
jgi:hypothetical protein